MSAKTATPARSGAETVSLREAVAADLALVRRWLAQPEIRSWWGNASAAEAEVALAFDSRSALCRIIEVDGQPVGYAHAIDASYWGASLPQGMPLGTYDLDQFVAEAGHRGQGVGQRALQLLAAEVFSTTLAPAVSVIAPLDNETAVRAYEKAGFRWARVIADPIFGPSWLMLIERPRR